VQHRDRALDLLLLEAGGEAVGVLEVADAADDLEVSELARIPQRDIPEIILAPRCDELRALEERAVVAHEVAPRGVERAARHHIRRQVRQRAVVAAEEDRIADELIREGCRSGPRRVGEDDVVGGGRGLAHRYAAELLALDPPRGVADGQCAVRVVVELGYEVRGRHLGLDLDQEARFPVGVDLGVADEAEARRGVVVVGDVGVLLLAVVEEQHAGVHLA